MIVPTWFVAVAVVTIMISSFNNHVYSMMLLRPGVVKQQRSATVASTLSIPYERRKRKTAFFRRHNTLSQRHQHQHQHTPPHSIHMSTDSTTATDYDGDMVQIDNQPSNTTKLSLLLESVTTKHHQPQLIPHTFAGMVERQLMEQFSLGTIQEEKEEGHTTNTRPSPIERILQSWRLLEQDYIHEEYIDHHDTDHSNSNNNNSNMAYQLCHSYVPGLTVREFWDVSQYDWCQQLASNYEVIRREFLSVISDVEHLQKHGNNVWATALDTNVAKQYGSGWSTLVLMNRGIWDPQNVQLFPRTSQIIYDCHIPAVEIFFASMQPNSTIPYHSDYTNFVLTSHLGIDIPNNGMNQCRLNVGGSTEEEWLNGKVMIFDTSIMHNAINENTEKVRYILMMRIWHPDLTTLERQALQYIYDTLEFPELVTTATNINTNINNNNMDARRRVEHQIQQAKAFPLLSLLQPPPSSKRSPRIGGFGMTFTTTPNGMASKKNKKKKREGRRN
jgi:Aspartyl/Asparaginyl beta-hydroxylase